MRTDFKKWGNYHARLRRQAQKIDAILRVVAMSGWIDLSVAAEVLCCHRKTAARTLLQMVRDGLVRSVVAGGLRVFIVTEPGLQAAGADGPIPRVGRVAAAYVPHRIAILRVRVRAERMGMTWKSPGRNTAGQRAPDGICVRPDGTRVAIEVELHQKSLSRYRRIVADYQMLLETGQYARVVYLCPPLKVAAVAAVLCRAGAGIGTEFMVASIDAWPGCIDGCLPIAGL